MAAVEPARARLGRIRCLIQAVESMKQGESLPEALCYVPKTIRLQCEGDEPVDIREQPKSSATSIAKLPAKKNHVLEAEGLPMFNEEGGWMKLVTPHPGNWVLVQPSKVALKIKWKLLETSGAEPSNWLEMVERLFSLQLLKQALPSSCDSEEIRLLQVPPPGWSLEADEELARFLVEQGGGPNVLDSAIMGSEHIIKIEASSCEVSTCVLYIISCSGGSVLVPSTQSHTSPVVAVF